MMSNRLRCISKNIKGLTIVEVMVAIIIAGIISAAIGSFLVVHIKSYEVAQDVIDIQYEAQVALNGMSEIIMESRGLYEIQDQDGHSYIDGTLINDGYVSNARVLVFEGLEVGTLPLYHVFIKEDGISDIMYYNTTNAAILDDIGRETLYARNVSNMAVIAAQGSYNSADDPSEFESFDESGGIEIDLSLQRGDDDNTLEIRTIAKYRNSRPD